jgi:hypothetical protein
MSAGAKIAGLMNERDFARRAARVDVDVLDHHLLPPAFIPELIDLRCERAL